MKRKKSLVKLSNQRDDKGPVVKHVRKHFQAWSEGSLDDEAHRLVEAHLEDCAECRLYFDRLSQFFEKPEADDLPRLKPDPFLAKRIRALADEPPVIHDRERPILPGLPRRLGWLRLSFFGVMFALAITTGGYLGQSVATRPTQNGDGQLTSIYEAFSQSGLGDDWEELLETDNNGQRKL